MPNSPPPHARFDEIEVSRLVLREPDSGRVRAVLELQPARQRDDDAPVYPRPTLTLFTAAGDPSLVVELDEVGNPRVAVGHPDRGASVVLTGESVSLWAGGNEVAVLSSEDGGRLELRDPEGRVRIFLPSKPT